MYVCGLLFALSPLAAAPLSAAPVSTTESAKSTWYQDLATGYQELAESSQRLQQKAAAYCGASAVPEQEELRAAWRSAFLDWQKVRFVDFGPIEQDNIAWQLQFWPDSKNLVARKADNWLNGEQTIDSAAIAADSVAANGFPALEYLLFDPRVAEGKQALPAARSCALLQAVSSQIETNAARLQRDWARFEGHYLERPEYAHTTVSAAMHALEILRDKRLAAPMGLGGKSRRNPYIADAWRSGESLAGMQTSLKGLQEYFLPGFRQLMAERGLTPLADQFGSQLEATLERLESMPPALSPLLENDEGYRSLQLLYIDIDRLTTLLNGTIASELGIIKGFNSSDGD